MVQVNQKAFPFLSNENVTVLLRYNSELKESSVYNLSQFIRTRIVLELKKKEKQSHHHHRCHHSQSAD